MPVLFALSILAFVALLWATISIAGFVRRARRRKRSAGQAADAIRGGLSKAAIPEARLKNDPATTYAGSDSSAPLTPEPPPPPRLRNFPTRLGKHPVSPLTPAASVDGKPEWNPFTEGIGDLSDPRASRRYDPPQSRKKSRRKDTR